MEKGEGDREGKGEGGRKPLGIQLAELDAIALCAPDTTAEFLHRFTFSQFDLKCIKLISSYFCLSLIALILSFAFSK